MLIGVTGQIGAGKSAVANLLKSKGALIVDADKVGKEVTGSVSVLKKLVATWDDTIVSKSGKLRPAKLAAIVFGDSTGRELERFNSIIRAPLGKAISTELQLAERVIKERGKVAPVVLDAALLPDWKIAEKMDLVVLVTSSQRVRQERLLERGLEEADIKFRMNRQSGLRRYREISDIVISNNLTPDALEGKIDRLWNRRILPLL